MPATAPPPAMFSYERDIAPYSNRFFDEVAADPRLSSSARARVQGGLLDGAQALQDREMKVREELDQQRSRRLAYETGVTALEEARARRARAEQAQAQMGGIHSLVTDIVGSDGTPEQKQQALADAELKNAPLLALNPDAKEIFNIAKGAVPERPKGMISNSEMFSSILKGIPQEELQYASESGDFSRLTGIAQQMDDADYLRKEKLKQMSGASKEAEDLRVKFLSTPLDFQGQKDEFGNKVNSPWLMPDSTHAAEVIIDHFGTPEEKKKFASLKTAPSDNDRALMIAQIQHRELVKRMGGASGAVDKAAVARKLITGK